MVDLRPWLRATDVEVLLSDRWCWWIESDCVLVFSGLSHPHDFAALKTADHFGSFTVIRIRQPSSSVVPS